MAAPVELSVDSAVSVACSLPAATLIDATGAWGVKATAIGSAALKPCNCSANPEESAASVAPSVPIGAGADRVGATAVAVALIVTPSGKHMRSHSIGLIYSAG